MGDWIEFAMFIAGLLAFLSAPAWIAWTVWHTQFAVATALQVTVAWCALVLWLAVR